MDSIGVNKMDINTNHNDNRSDDLAILKRWVKKELFDLVKFLYNPDNDLKIGGSLYNLFIRDCKDKLVGLKQHQGNREFRRMYVESLWTEATRNKSNLVADGLNTRRSAIYSGMQNHFVGTSNATGSIRYDCF